MGATLVAMPFGLRRDKDIATKVAPTRSLAGLLREAFESPTRLADAVEALQQQQAHT